MSLEDKCFHPIDHIFKKKRNHFKDRLFHISAGIEIATYLAKYQKSNWNKKFLTHIIYTT